MAINIFEGARRVAKVILGVIAVITAVACYDEIQRTDRFPTYLNHPFQIESEGAKPVRVDTCHLNAKVVKDVAVKTSDGIEVKADFCLLYWGPWKDYEAIAKKYGGNPAPFDPDEYLKGKGQGNIFDQFDPPKAGTFDDLILAGTVKFSDADEDMIRGIRRANKFEILMRYFFYLVVWLAGWWIFVWTVGWIVRGFMSIPRGSDRRN